MKWQKIKETHGLAPTTSPRYTTTLSRRHPGKSNPWRETEAAFDAAMGHRYSCAACELRTKIFIF